MFLFFRVIIAAALALTLAGTVQAHAQGASLNPLANPSDNQPLEINADSGIEWQQNAMVYIARGNAVAKRGNSELHGNTLVAHYRPLKAGTKPASANAAEGQMGNTEIYRVDADGGVMLKREAQTVVGDHLVYDVDKGIAVITGKGLKMTTTTDMVTARDSLEWYDQKQVAVARGDAVAIRNGKTIKADILTAYMVKTNPPGAPANGKPAPPKPSPAAKPGAPGTPAPQESKISRVDAQGHVIVTNDRDTGRGDYAVYNAITGISTLIGNVVLTRGSDVLRGQAAVMDMNNNVSRILPNAGVPGSAPQRVQGLFVKEDATGANKPAAAAPAKPPAKAQ